MAVGWSPIPGSERAGGDRSGLHQVHQPGSRPKRRRVESGAPRFRSLLAESGDRRIDDPLIDRADIVIADVQTFAGRYRHIGNKHIGGLDEAFESRPPRLSFNVERNSPLVPIVDNVAVRILGKRRVAAPAMTAAEWVGTVRRFDLNHISSKIRQHDPRCGSRDIGCEFNDLYAVEDGLAHTDLNLLLFDHVFPTPRLARRVRAARRARSATS